MKAESVLLDSMSGFDFENFFARLLTKLGQGKILKVLYTQDEGRDILLESPTGLVVVECKHHPDGSIGRPVVQKLHSAVISSKASKGMLVTTGHFTKEALDYALKVSPRIEMIDRPILSEMAAKAGMRLVFKGESMSVWTYSIPAAEATWTVFTTHLSSILKGYPRTIGLMLNDFRRTVHFDPIYMITYDLDAVFSTSIGVVHREQAHQAKVAIDGSKGSELNPAVTQFIAPEAQADFLEVPHDFRGKLLNFRIDSTTLRNNTKSIIAGKHARVVTYHARHNRRRYQKTCVPSDRDIAIINVRQVYLPRLELSFKLLQTPYVATLFHAPSGRILPRFTDATTCRVCHGSIPAKGIICDTCGRSTHSGGFFVNSKHGFRCRRCKRTTCRIDGAWTRRLFVLKALLCPACTEAARKTGKKVSQLSPLRVSPRQQAVGPIARDD